jgi:hypothetical protein
VDNTTMLALDDAALARICIAATALRRRRRQRWLKDLAERVDPPPRRVMREPPKAKPPGGSKARPRKDRVASGPDHPKPLADYGIDKHLADRARKARHRARQPSQPVAPIPDAHYTRVGGRCAAPRWASGLARAV